MTVNKQVLLTSRPQGAVSTDNFRLVDVPLSQPGEGQLLVRHDYLSLDPYMRGRMDDAKNYVQNVAIDEVMVGAIAGEVIASNHARFKVGDKVIGAQGWQLYSLSDGRGLTRVDTTVAPLSYYLGVLGMPGLTAWIGLIDIGKAKAGETVVVSAASGAVGSVVGQLAKLRGCRVIGIAGGPAKCGYCVSELGFDACVDYKAGRLLEDLQAATPQGVDVYFDNVGGEILDAVLTRMNAHSRIPLCGTISQYDGAKVHGVRNFRSFLVNRIMLQGFIMSDYKSVWPQAIAELTQAVKEGKLKYRESVAEGLERAPQAFIGMLKGENFGKQVVKLT